MVHGEPGAVGDRLQLLERHLEAVRAREGARGDERVAAREVAALEARQADGDALPGLGTLDGRIVHLHRADRARRVPRLEAEPVAVGDRPRPEGAGRDRPDPAEREDAVDVEPGREVRAALLDLARDSVERLAEHVEPVARDAADRDHRGSGDELARLLERQLERLGVDRVGLRDGDDALLDAEQPQDREVLVRLRPGALGRVDHEEEEVDAGRAGDHRAHEALVTGHVDEGERPPARQLERGVAEVDRDPARLLLGEPVGVLAGQRADERRLAVVDVPGGADGQRHGGESESAWHATRAL